MTTFNASANLTASVQIFAPTIHSWIAMSGPLLDSAALFARDAYAIEQAHSAQRPSDPDRRRHRALVLSGIVAACSAVEGFANEVFLAAQEPVGTVPFGQDALALIELTWETNIEKQPPLTKVQLALALAGAQKFDTGAAPYQAAALAFDLRNTIVHYKARNVGAPSAAAHSHTKLEGKLTGAFPTNLWENGALPLFPNRCISHGCLEWVITALIGVLDEYARRTNTPPLSDPNNGWDFGLT